MAGKKLNLRKFLRNEVQKGKIKASESDPPTRPTTPNSGGRNSLTQENLFDFGSPLGSAKLNSLVDNDTNGRFRDPDVDSVFGEPLDTPSIKDQELQAQLEQLLAEGTPISPVARSAESTDL